MELLECPQCGASILEGDSYCAECKNPITAEQYKEESESKKVKAKKKSTWRGYFVVIVWWIIAAIVVLAFIIVGVGFAVEVFNTIRGG